MYTDKTLPQGALVRLNHTHEKRTFKIHSYDKNSGSYNVIANYGMFEQEYVFDRDEVTRVHAPKPKKVVRTQNTGLNPSINLSEQLRAILNNPNNAARRYNITPPNLNGDTLLATHNWASLGNGVHTVSYGST